MNTIIGWKRKVLAALNEKGASAVEYALISGVFVGAILIGLAALDEGARANFTSLVNGDNEGEELEVSTVPSAPSNGSISFTSGEIAVFFQNAERADTHVLTCVAQSDNSVIGWDSNGNPPLGVFDFISLTDNVNDLETYDCEVTGWNAGNAGGFGPSLLFENVAIADSLSAPRLLTATAGDTFVNLGWQEPAVEGESLVNDYLLQIVPAPEGSPSGYVSIGNVLSYTVIGLTNDVAYTFNLKASNASEQSVEASVLATPVQDPSAPNSPDLTAVGILDEGILTWTAPDDNGSPLTEYRVAYKLNSATSWSSFVSVPATELTHTFNLSQGIWDFQIIAVNAIGVSNPSIVSAVPLVGFSDPPTGLTVNSTGNNGELATSWTAPVDTGGASLSGYYVDVSLNNSFTSLEQTQFVNSTSYTITGLTNGTTYYVRVKAENIVGLSDPSVSVSGIPSGSPDAPVVSGTPSDSTISLTWTTPYDGGAAITGYELEYSENSSFSSVTSNSYADTITSDNLSSLTNGTIYYVRVRALNVNGSGTWSNVVSETPFTVPDAPVVTTTDGFEEFTATWTTPNINGSSIINYQIERSTDLGFSSPDSETLNSNTKIYDPAVAQTTYYVRVRAENAAGFGPWSTVVQSTPYTTPSAPTAVSVTPNIDGITYVWSVPNNGGSSITEYIVQYDIVNTFVSPTSASVSPNTTTATIAGLSSENTYYFRVQAVNIAGDSGWSTPILSEVPLSVPDKPVITLDVDSVESGIVVNWVEPDDNGLAITDYVVMWGTSSGVYSGSVNIPSPTLTATIPSLTPETSYYVTLLAQNAAGDSPHADEVTAIPYAKPDAPTGLQIDKTASNSLDLVWVEPDDNGRSISSYVIERSNDSLFTSVTSFVSNTESFQDTGLTNEQTYYYRIAAVNEAGQGPWSTIISDFPAGEPDAPILSYSHSGINEITFTWNTPNDNGSPITGYNILVCVSAGCSTLLENISATGNSRVVTDADITSYSIGTGWNYHITASNSIGTSPLSNNLLLQGWEEPDPPTNLDITDTALSADVTWDAPVYTGASGGVGVTAPTITSYTLEYSNANDFSNSTVVTGITGTSYTITSLLEGNVYVRVKALNAVGESLWVSGNETITGFPSGTINWGVTDNPVLIGVLTVDWTEHQSGGLPVLEAEIEYWNVLTPASTSSVTDSHQGGTATHFRDISGIIPGEIYELRIRLRNANGWGAWSSTQTITPSYVPDTPIISEGNYNVSNPNEYTIEFPVPDNNNDPITGYLITQDGNVITPSYTLETSGTQTITVTSSDGAVAGSLHDVTVTAVNGQGNSSASNIIEFNPWDLPDAPTITVTGDINSLTVTKVSDGDFNGTAPVEWAFDVYNCETGYTLVTSVSTSINPQTVTGLQAGDMHCVEAYHKNSIPLPGDATIINGTKGTSVSGTPFGIPDAPAVTSTITGNGEAGFNFTIPSDNGSPIIEYQIQRSGGGTIINTFEPFDSGTTDFAYTGLNNGTIYTFKIRARNSAGWGAYSSSISAVPFGTPDAATITTSRLNRGLRVNITQGDNNGSTVTGYRIQYRIPAQTSTWTDFCTACSVASFYDIYSLADNQEYQVRVFVQSNAGQSPVSNLSSVTPWTNTMNQNERFYAGYKVESTSNTSASNYYVLEFGSDGKVRFKNSSGTTLWTSSTTGSSGYNWRTSNTLRNLRQAVPNANATPTASSACEGGTETTTVQTNGNFVVRSGSVVIWSRTTGQLCF